ncbi:acyl-[acyl-carrier-protein] thioesterase [Leuconostoc gasicomitatum]|uniref:acyl-[acyl-carrier-protein] thioesterase n=1 Tax=Leuconostoc gasicomitatum TaxID=115778 RepID=UPI0007E1065D|nr:acyl-ACP thioesterase domain-containing protein [Leuconostoc gasicomitatum]MBZ5969100.1 acyl-ACP thioesterase [Leuconostoc gasicomitatum]MBZ5985134.1 acyl-ACP thioesterase [Leuconostoc gasicomitatum]MBZ5998417.1 acyl-ACP thioesterase [Leuconostoc gasicomitatum]CUW07608.1 Acyl-ACP thioesterase [Leuconostoc gasicomitatum]
MHTFEIKRHVEYYEADTTGKLTLPMILNWAVLASKKQSDALGVGQKIYLGRGLGWIILQYEVHITRRPKINEEITIKTYAAKYNPFFVSRPFVFFDTNGNEIIRVDSIWAMIDIENRRMARLPQDIIDKYQAERVKQIPRIAKPAQFGTDDVFEENDYHVRYLDIDANKHVNNSKYFEWMQDVITPEFLATHEVTDINLKFENEVRLGHTIQSQVILQEHTSKHRIMLGDVVSAEAEFQWRDVSF